MGNHGAGDHLAILIDADNISYKLIAGLMAEVANYGTVSVRRIYGDWTSPLMKGWRECLLEHSLVPIQQSAYTTGKNATDGAMIIDAMDLLYTARFASFCLVTSDSDFTRLAARIREQGITVYGFGNRHNTHRAFVAACNEFVYLDALPMQADETSKNTAHHPFNAPSASLKQILNSTTSQAETSSTPTTASPSTQAPASLDVRGAPHTGPKPAFNHHAHLPSLPTRPTPFLQPPRKIDQAALDVLRTAIESSNVYEDDYVNLAEVGIYLLKISPDLNGRNYGYPRLKDFVAASGIAEIKMKPRPPAPAIALMRLKDRW